MASVKIGKQGYNIYKAAKAEGGLLKLILKSGKNIIKNIKIPAFRKGLTEFAEKFAKKFASKAKKENKQLAEAGHGCKINIRDRFRSFRCDNSNRCCS